MPHNRKRPRFCVPQLGQELKMREQIALRKRCYFVAQKRRNPDHRIAALFGFMSNTVRTAHPPAAPVPGLLGAAAPG